MMQTSEFFLLGYATRVVAFSIFSRSASDNRCNEKDGGQQDLRGALVCLRDESDGYPYSDSWDN